MARRVSNRNRRKFGPVQRRSDVGVARVQSVCLQRLSGMHPPTLQVYHFLELPCINSHFCNTVWRLSPDQSLLIAPDGVVAAGGIILLSCIFYHVTATAELGDTIGMLAFDLRVVWPDGLSIGYRTAILRSLIPGLAGLALCCGWILGWPSASDYALG